jgi:hypothetical protein
MMKTLDDYWNDVKQLPDWLYIAVLLLGSTLLVIGLTILTGYLERF